MKMVTGGIFRPPYVPTVPDLLTPAARYPARNAACAVSNCIENTFDSGILASTMANFWLALAFAALVVASPMRPPTATIRSHFCCTNWVRFGT